MLEGVLIDEAIEVALELAGDLTGWSRTGPIQEPCGAFSIKAMHPLSHRRVGEVEAVGDHLHTSAFDHLAYRLSASKEPRLLGFFEERLQLGQGIIGKLKVQIPHEVIPRFRPKR